MSQQEPGAGIPWNSQRAAGLPSPLDPEDVGPNISEGTARQQDDELTSKSGGKQAKAEAALFSVLARVLPPEGVGQI